MISTAASAFALLPYFLGVVAFDVALSLIVSLDQSGHCVEVPFSGQHARLWLHLRILLYPSKYNLLAHM